MFKLKISQLNDFEKSNNKRTDFITYFEDETDAKKAFNYVLQEQAQYIINQKKTTQNMKNTKQTHIKKLKYQNAKILTF